MSKKFNTKVIHSSYNPDEHNRALMPPIYQNSMFKLHAIGEDVPYKYARVSNPTRDVLEKTIADLENGHSGFAFSSGIAAIDAVWRTFLKPGDTIVAVEDIYGGSYDLLVDVYDQWGIKVIFADLSNPDTLVHFLQKEKITLVWLESPSNPILKLIDIKKLTEIAHEYGCLVGIDNTFASPYLQKPIDFNVDFVVHSATKYLSGHSDVLLGLAVTKTEQQTKKLRKMQIQSGAVAGPADCSLTLRGIKTLAVRMRQHQENAMIIAERLQTHPAVEKVIYPGLITHPQHELAKEQMNGFGGVVSIYLKDNTISTANQVITSLKLLQLTASLGGVESLVNHCFTQSHNGMSPALKKRLGVQEGLLRLSIGIEDVEDIWNDLNHALNTI